MDKDEEFDRQDNQQVRFDHLKKRNKKTIVYERKKEEWEDISR
jgi:hypothetical protein